MRFHSIPSFFQAFFPNFVWSVPEKENVIYLTFDDGPIPYITEFVLDQLEAYQAKGTFFCVGDNIRKHPGIFEKILLNGHQVGNHTFNHLNGWNTDNQNYIQNIEECSSQINLFENLLPSLQKPLFRPPYGKIKSVQYKQIKDQYKVVMWSVLSYDFDKSISPERCLQKSIQYTKKGAIVVFHDNIKTEKCIRYVLPRYLEHFRNLGYRFEKLS